ncbi:hypothetical protein BKA81DRAFT_234631 [Phyllosticta paracitricarpa]|uniref:Uncharacterized protein n=1 Tax=Phyllosticta paracitricarpa TaxID=2016321 RepID=A0ABR1MRU8_9PEZI
MRPVNSAADLVLSRQLLFSRHSHPNTPRHDSFRTPTIGIMLSTLLLHRHFFIFFPFSFFPLATATSMYIMTVSLFRRNGSAGRITCCLWCRPSSSVASLISPSSSASLIQPQGGNSNRLPHDDELRTGDMGARQVVYSTQSGIGKAKGKPARAGRVGDGLGME